MTNLLKVQDADEGASEQATETRRLLQVWADKHLPDVPADVIQSLTGEEVKRLCGIGAEHMQNSAAYLAALPEHYEYTPKSQFSALLGAFVRSTRDIFTTWDRETACRDLSYAFEGAVREFHKRFYQAGMKWNLHAEYLAALAFQVPRATGQYQDRLYSAQCGFSGTLFVASCALRNTANDPQHYLPPIGKTTDSMIEKFTCIEGWILGNGVTPERLAQMEERRRRDWVYSMTSLYPVLHFNYMDADGPWIAGFLTAEDACRMKFSRVRLGAYLASEGLDDATVRDKVERAKQAVAQAEFHAVPNDCLWADVYTGGVNSCMSGDADEYHTWDGIHPVDTYASSYYGAGDNSLVLIYTKDGSEVTGRGILNLQSGKIVRWYGDPVAERALKRSGVSINNREALAGTWLALIEQDKRFIHPYTDGDLAYGEIKDDRVYITGDSSHPCLQYTSGSSYRGKVYYCEDLDQDMGEDECEYQPLHNTYVSNDCDDDWRCPASGEYVHPNNRTWMELYGERVQVSDYLDQHRYQRAWLFELDNGNWGIQDANLRAQFIGEYDIDEDDDDEEEQEEDAA